MVSYIPILANCHDAIDHANNTVCPVLLPTIVASRNEKVVIDGVQVTTLPKARVSRIEGHLAKAIVAKVQWQSIEIMPEPNRQLEAFRYKHFFRASSALLKQS